jgi:hypothetical protein
MNASLSATAPNKPLLGNEIDVYTPNTLFSAVYIIINRGPLSQHLTLNALLVKLFIVPLINNLDKILFLFIIDSIKDI